MKETFLLVHSAWLGAWQWNTVKELLVEAGHSVITPDLPGHGENLTPEKEITMQDYVDCIVNLLDQQEESVVLLGHSFNGITVSRVAEVRPNKIKSIVYLAAFLAPAKSSFISMVKGVEGSVAVENFYFSDDQSHALVKASEMHQAFAHDISEEAFAKASSFILPEPAKPLFYELEITDENWGAIPKYYIECTLDKAIPIAIQRAMYNGKVEKIYSLEASHTPNFSQPNKLANILIELVK